MSTTTTIPARASAVRSAAVAVLAAAACGPAAGPRAPLGNQAAATSPATLRARYELRVDPAAEATVVTRAIAPSPAERAALHTAAATGGDYTLTVLDDPPVPPPRNTDDEGWPPDGTAHYLDLDGDKAVDVVLMDTTFYGPSHGYIVFLRDGAAFRRSWADPGKLTGVEATGDHLIVRFELEILAEGEPRVVRVLDWDRAAQRWSDGPVSYVAAQGDVPAIEPGGAFTLAAATALRFAPAIDDASPVATDDYAKTKTLGGNVVARYAAGAKGLVLGARGDWRFVGLDAMPPPTATSYEHGMLVKNAPVTDEVVSDPPPGSIYCGWVPASAIATP